MKTYLLYIVAGLIILSACTRNAGFKQQSNSLNIITFGQAPFIPTFDLEDLDGNHISYEDFRGKYLVIHIATTWCPFCNAEAPHLNALQEKYRDKNVAVIIIDVKEDRELVQHKLADRFELSFPILLDRDGQVAASLAPEGVLPELERYEVMLASNLIIDPAGKIKYMSLLDSQNFDAELTDLRAVLDEMISDQTVISFDEDSFYLEADRIGPVSNGQAAMIQARLRIPSGHYIQAHDLKDINLIPVEINVEPMIGFDIGTPKYSKYRIKSINGSQIPYRVYKDPVYIQIPIRVKEGIAGNYKIKASISFQACSENKCFMPSTKSIEIPIQII